MTRISKLLPVAGLAAALVVSSSAFSTSDNSKQSKFEPARNAQGHPNMQGTWDFRTLTPLERPTAMADKATFDSAEEEEAYRTRAIALNDVDVQRDSMGDLDVEGAYNAWWMDYGTELNEDRRTSLIVDPPNGRLPALTPAALASLKTNLIRKQYPVRDILSLQMDNLTFRPEGPEAVGLSERCLLSFNAGPPLMPNAYNNNIRIVQTPKHVVIFTEMIHDARIVPMDGSSHLPGELQKWTGDSRGHWDGDTLVVETKNFTDKTPTYQLPLNLNDLERNGAPGSGKNMKLTERFTLASASRLIYEYTLDDPTTFAKPFTVAIPMKSTEDQIYEYACHEGNHAMAGMLGGARQMEKETATALQ
jgi:hypothetical protein